MVRIKHQPLRLLLTGFSLEYKAEKTSLYNSSINATRDIALLQEVAVTQSYGNLEQKVSCVKSEHMRPQLQPLPSTTRNVYDGGSDTYTAVSEKVTEEQRSESFAKENRRSREGSKEGPKEDQKDEPSEESRDICTDIPEDWITTNPDTIGPAETNPIHYNESHKEGESRKHESIAIPSFPDQVNASAQSELNATNGDKSILDSALLLGLGVTIYTFVIILFGAFCAMFAAPYFEWPAYNNFLTVIVLILLFPRLWVYLCEAWDLGQLVYMCCRNQARRLKW
jgi:hypothetical protein